MPWAMANIDGPQAHPGPPSTSITPFLQSLTYRCDLYSIADWTLLFFAPSIVELYLSSSSGVPVPQMSPKGIFFQTLSEAVKLHVNLRSLTIDIHAGAAQFSFTDQPGTMESLQSILMLSKDLTHLNLPNGATLYTTILPRLSPLLFLQSLELGSLKNPVNSRGIRPWTVMDPFSGDSFVSLKRLVLTCTISLALNIINLINSGLEDLSLHVPPSPYQYDLTSWFMAARGKFKASLRTFHLTYDMKGEHSQWSGSHLLSFVSGLQLVELGVDLSGGLFLDDNIVRDLGASCRSLKVIEFSNGSFLQEPLGITWRGVVELSRQCRRLRTLQIVFDATTPVTSMVELAATKLRGLHVGNSPIENAPNIVNLFQKVFPSLRVLRYGHEKWDEVYNELNKSRAEKTKLYGGLNKDLLLNDNDDGHDDDDDDDDWNPQEEDF
jgi:hypothetical protein